MALGDCIVKAGPALGKSDRQQLRRLVDEGLSEVQAVQQLLDAANADIRRLEEVASSVRQIDELPSETSQGVTVTKPSQAQPEAAGEPSSRPAPEPRPKTAPTAMPAPAAPAEEIAPTPGQPRETDIERFSLSSEAEPLAEAWMKIARDDAVFSYARSEATDFETIMGEISSDMRVEDARRLPEDVVRAWNVVPPNHKGRGATIIEYRDGKVELNVFHLEKGQGGSAIYAAVGNYAFNNGLTFAADRKDLSDLGKIRRLENLVSLVLKFQSTDFIEPFGRDAVNWKRGDHVKNLQYMLEESYENVRRDNPWIDDYEFNRQTNRIGFRSDVGPGRRRFLESAQRQRARRDTPDRAERLGGFNRTIRRAIFTGSLLSSSKSREILKGDGQNRDLVQIFYSLGTGEGTTGRSDITYTLNPGVAEKADAIEADLRARLAKVGIADRVAVKLVKEIRNAKGGLMSGANGRYAGRVIEIAAGAPKKAWVMDHEIIHGLRDLGLIRPAEWRALSREARADEGLQQRYAKLNLSDEQLIEEAVADMHANWAAGQQQAKGFIRTAFERIRNFLQALGNALRGNGFQSASDIFQSIGRGEVGARPSRAPLTSDPRFQQAFHGTQAVFDRFRTDKIGTGEGAQAYGWGLYFAENEKVARSYRHAGGLRAEITVNGEKVEPRIERVSLYRYAAEGNLDKYIADNQEVLDTTKPEDVDGYGAEIIRSSKSRIADAKALKGADVQFVEPVGTVYEVKIQDEAVARMLDWNAPLSKQPASVRKALQLMLDSDLFSKGDAVGATLYRQLAGQLGSQKAASDALSETGITGIKYFDAMSRATTATGGGFLTPLANLIRGKKGTRNLVVFNDSIITIKSVDGKPVAKEAFALGPEGQPVERKPVPKFENEESELRWVEARKGVRNVDTWLQRMKARADHIRNGFSRHFIELPNTAQFSQAREQLIKVEASPQASKEEVLRTLYLITKGMTREDMDLFTRKVILDDLQFEVAEQHQLPFGFTPATVKSELARLDALIVNRPDIQEKLKLRKAISDKIADDMVTFGVLHKEQIKNPAYYRHQVLDYARAQVAYAKTPGKKLKTPHWARRMGSQLDINANLLEAEFEWMQKALNDITVAKALDWFKRSDYNVRDQAIANAKAHNQRFVDAILEKDIRDNGYKMKNGQDTSPINQEWRKFRQRIAVGLKKVREAIETGQLGDIPFEFQSTADHLLSETQGETSLFPFLGWILDNDKPGSMGAAMAFKAVNQRKAWIRTHLGEKYADPMQIDNLVKRGFAPPGSMTWQPDKGMVLFTAKTIPEHVIDRMMERIAQDTGPIPADEIMGALESVRSVLAVGGLKYQMILPEELAKTLNNMRDRHAEGLIQALVEFPVRLWKRWMLISPRRVVKYNLNNLSGDLDGVIAGNPKVLWKLPQAIKELWQVMYRRKEPSARYREAVELGVFNSGLTVQEIPDINYMSEFENLINPPTILQPGRLLVSRLMKIWRGLQKFTWFRENWLRYAAYLHYAPRLEAGESMRSIGYGASKKEMVDAVEDPKSRGALLSRDLVGDYGAISAFGQGIRRTTYPFYSWLEVNTKRYWRLGANAWQQGVGHGLATTGFIGASLGVRTTAYLYIRMWVVYGTITLWNNMVFGDEEDELGAEARARLHLILGRDKNGEIVTMRLQGALSDFLDWFGFDDAVGMLSEIEQGRASIHDLIIEMAKAPVNKIAAGITPVIKAPVEFLSGSSYWPDSFRPRKIRDRWRHLFRMLAFEHEYDVIFDRPSRGYARSLTQALVYRREPGATAYGRMKGMAYDWQRRVKGTTGTGYQSPRSTALYNWRLAKKFKDRKAERAAMKRMRELGISNADIRSSIRNAHPLGGLSIKDRGAFLRTLNRREKQVLKDSIAWYRETYID